MHCSDNVLLNLLNCLCSLLVNTGKENLVFHLSKVVYRHLLSGSSHYQTTYFVLIEKEELNIY